MNARIIKETRALLPAFGVTVGVTLIMSLVWRGNSALGAGLVFFTISCTLMGASCVGNEFSSRTMPLLLAQPLPRKQIWNEKMLVMGVAILLAFAAWLACLGLFTDRESFGKDWPWAVFDLAFICAGILCSTPWLALLARNTLVAVLLAWCLPMALFLAGLCLGWFIGGQPLLDQISNFPPACFIGVVLLYFGVTYCLGYGAFKKFQAAEVRQMEIALPERLQNALARPLGKLLPGYTGTMASLERKELLLQRPVYISAGALCVLAFFGAVAQKLHPSEVNLGLLAADLVSCVLILPLVATGLSVAEERNLGVANWHRALPVSARKQWLVKLAVTVGTCVLLGVILPVIMGLIGRVWLGRQTLSWFDSNDWPPLGGTVNIVLGYLLFLAVGVFASSVSTTTFRAILLTFALLAAGATVIPLSVQLVNWLGSPENWSNTVAPLSIDSQGRTMYVVRENWRQFWENMLLAVVGLGLALMASLAVLLAYLNYRTNEPAARRAWLHSGIFLGVLTVVSLMLCLLLFLPQGVVMRILAY